MRVIVSKKPLPTRTPNTTPNTNASQQTPTTTTTTNFADQPSSVFPSTTSTTTTTSPQAQPHTSPDSRYIGIEDDTLDTLRREALYSKQTRKPKKHKASPPEMGDGYNSADEYGVPKSNAPICEVCILLVYYILILKVFKDG